MKKILVVEDNEISRYVTAVILRVLNYDVIEAASAAAAFAAANEQQPDLILIEVALREGDGLKVVKDLRASPLTGRIPILALTALASEEDRERILAAGCDDCLAKPVTAQHLMLAVDGMLRR